MNRIIILILISLAPFHLTVSAQELADDLEINNEDLESLILSAIRNSTQLAQTESKLKSYDYEKNLVKNQWWGQVVIGGNLNELSIQQFGDSDPNQNLFFPRYNIGLSLPLNTYAKVKNERKIVEQNQLQVVAETEEVKRQLTETVKKQYIAYLKASKVLKLKKTIEQFVVADFKAVENRFSEGSARLEEYSEARKSYYNFKIEVMDAKSQYLSAKAELETTCNTTLEALGIE